MFFLPGNSLQSRNKKHLLPACNSRKRSCYTPGIATLSLLILLQFITGCIYSPSQQPFPDTTENNSHSSGKTGSGTLFSINTRQQTCNPSISNSLLFDGCMLWLGFDKLSVNVPQEFMDSYPLTGIVTHDRLTITDTSNTVRWHIFRKDFSPQGEIQCPEWSTHPDYIACLTGTKMRPYSGYAIRLSDKKTLKIIDNALEEFSTPHFWADTSSTILSAPSDSIRYDQNGVVDQQSLSSFFGTTGVIYTYSLSSKGGSIFYIDFSKSSVPVKLPKPQDKESWTCHSPLISPDGNWVTYHCYLIPAQGLQYASYIQRITPDSKPILIAEEASDPHWWVDMYNNNAYYIIYSYTPGNYFLETDFVANSTEPDGTSGFTIKQKLTGTWRPDAPLHAGGLSPDYTMPPDTLIRLPFKGGLSPDGRFLGTAYKYAYILKLD